MSNTNVDNKVDNKKQGSQPAAKRFDSRPDREGNNPQPGQHNHPPRNKPDGQKSFRENNPNRESNQNREGKPNRENNQNRESKPNREYNQNRESNPNRENSPNREAQGQKNFHRDGQGKQGGYYHNQRQSSPVKVRGDETVEDIRADIVRIEKEIDLEIKEIKTMRLGM